MSFKPSSWDQQYQARFQAYSWLLQWNAWTLGINYFIHAYASLYLHSSMQMKFYVMYAISGLKIKSSRFWHVWMTSFQKLGIEVLLIEPLPSINKIYSMVVREDIKNVELLSKPSLIIISKNITHSSMLMTQKSHKIWVKHSHQLVSTIRKILSSTSLQLSRPYDRYKI